MTELKGQRLRRVSFHQCPEVTANRHVDPHLEDRTSSVRRGARPTRALQGALAWDLGKI